MEECYEGVDSEEEEVNDDQDGVINLEDYINCCPLRHRLISYHFT